MADAIERDIEAHPDSAETPELVEVLTWLRYRLARIRNTAPTPVTE